MIKTVKIDTRLIDQIASEYLKKQKRKRVLYDNNTELLKFIVELRKRHITFRNIKDAVKKVFNLDIPLGTIYELYKKAK